jgi:hypothetical protein
MDGDRVDADRLTIGRMNGLLVDITPGIRLRPPAPRLRTGRAATCLAAPPRRRPARIRLTLIPSP